MGEAMATTLSSPVSPGGGRSARNSVKFQPPRPVSAPPQPASAPPRPPSGPSEADFLHGEISRAEAETLIQNAGGTDGTFLVRRKGANYTISVTKGGMFEHHMASNSRGGPFTLNGKPTSAPCATLSALV